MGNEHLMEIGFNGEKFKMTKSSVCKKYVSLEEVMQMEEE